MIANVKKSVFNLEMLDAVKRETTSAPAILDNQVGVVLAIPLNQIIEDEISHAKISMMKTGKILSVI